MTTIQILEQNIVKLTCYIKQTKTNFTERLKYLAQTILLKSIQTDEKCYKNTINKSHQGYNTIFTALEEPDKQWSLNYYRFW